MEQVIRQELPTFQAPRTPETEPLEVFLVHGSPRRINEYLFEESPLPDAFADMLLSD